MYIDSYHVNHNVITKENILTITKNDILMTIVEKWLNCITAQCAWNSTAYRLRWVTLYHLSDTLHNFDATFSFQAVQYSKNVSRIEQVAKALLSSSFSAAPDQRQCGKWNTSVVTRLPCFIPHPRAAIWWLGDVPSYKLTQTAHVQHCPWNNSGLSTSWAQSKPQAQNKFTKAKHHNIVRC